MLIWVCGLAQCVLPMLKVVKELPQQNKQNAMMFE